MDCMDFQETPPRKENPRPDEPDGGVDSNEGCPHADVWISQRSLTDPMR